MNNYFLIKESSCYSDEFDCIGFTLVKCEKSKRKLYEIILDYCEKNLLNKDLYFGSNEAVMLETIEEIRQVLDIITLSKDEYKTILTYLGKSYGLTPILNNIPIQKIFDKNEIYK